MGHSARELFKEEYRKIRTIRTLMGSFQFIRVDLTGNGAYLDGPYFGRHISFYIHHGGDVEVGNKHHLIGRAEHAKALDRKRFGAFGRWGFTLPHQNVKEAREWRLGADAGLERIP